jgi:septal ring factor EnvC (AmiA/AmiB activator)
MSIFAKKPEWEQKIADAGIVPPPQQPQLQPQPQVVAKGSGYGIAEAIALLRGLPADNSELVVRVVQATLASVDVHLHDIIEDATRRQKATQDRIAAVHAQIAQLERQLEGQRREVATLEADLKETTSVKERLQQADRTATLSTGWRDRRQTPAMGAASLEQTPSPQVLAGASDDADYLKD